MILCLESDIEEEAKFFKVKSPTVRQLSNLYKPGAGVKVGPERFHWQCFIQLVRSDSGVL